MMAMTIATIGRLIKNLEIIRSTSYPAKKVEPVWASLLSNHPKLFNEINSLRERLLGTHRPAKRAWLLRGRPCSPYDGSATNRGGHGGPPLHPLRRSQVIATSSAIFGSDAAVPRGPSIHWS